MFSNFEQYMKELWSSSVFWRVLINSIGVVSVILGFWLLFKLIKFIYSLRKNKNLNAKNYIDLLPIPSEFKGNVQIGITLNNKQNIDFNILDNKEINEFSKRIKDDITVDLLAQFSEALRKKYKITINDDVIDQLN